MCRSAVCIRYHITSHHSAFLLYLNVKIVPFLAWLLLGRKPQLYGVISALLAVGGTVILTSEGAGSTGGTIGVGGLGEGDLWSVAAAFASALFILRLEVLSVRHSPGQVIHVLYAT